MIDKSLNKLIKKARDGDDGAFDELIRRIKNDLYRIARSRLTNDDDALDAVQEAILTMYRSIIGLKKIDSFKVWAGTIVVNKCNDIYNEKLRQNELSLDEVSEIAVEDKNQSIEILEELEKEEKLLLTLFYVEGYKYKEIAKMLNINMNTVKTKVLRARRKLMTNERRKLDD